MRARPHAPAHPRSRGEHTFTLDGAGGNRGSSPLARGTQSGTVRAAAGRRLIPARAGNTQNGLGAAKSISAHPRSRGEHPLIMVAAVAWFRLIPARAGNTWVRKALPGRGAAHPRSRGEHRCRSSASAGYVGSSPLARGTLGALVVVGAGLRLIPARAGNTWSLRRERNSLAAHPRSRGEHCDVPRVHDGFSGSSPLARGTQSERGVGLIGWRLIPARAGNTRLKSPRVHLSTAHPRSRGEHASMLRASWRDSGSSPLARGTLTALERPAGVSGSSPLARGTRFVDLKVPRLCRLIPARAGNTRLGALRTALYAAHPRSRGEHRVRNGLDYAVIGSSPLARGTQPHF